MSEVWITPPEIVEPICKFFGGPHFDPCTEPDNPTKAAQYFTEQKPNDLGLCWSDYGLPVFVHPPHDKTLGFWLRQLDLATRTGLRVPIVALLAANRMNTKDFQNYVLTPRLWSITFPADRISFLTRDGRRVKSRFESYLFTYNMDKVPRGSRAWLQTIGPTIQGEFRPHHLLR